MNPTTRPTQATILAIALAASAAFTFWLGTMATGFYVPAATLLLAAALLWFGRAPGLFKWMLLANQLSAIVMLVMLLTPLAAWLHLPKLEIAGVMLLLHLLAGGPLMALMALVVLGTMHFSPTIGRWFSRPGHAGALAAGSA
ncbi:MAG TPA: hypothetical protein PLO41_08560 [Rubrivivax sp.]|nr:hypothetical protein [Rubrivivax sp.]